MPPGSTTAGLPRRAPITRGQRGRDRRQGTRLRRSARGDGRARGSARTARRLEPRRSPLRPYAGGPSPLSNAGDPPPLPWEGLRSCRPTPMCPRGYTTLPAAIHDSTLPAMTAEITKTAVCCRGLVKRYADVVAVNGLDLEDRGGQRSI